MRTLTIGKLVKKFPAIIEFDYSGNEVSNALDLHDMLHLYGYELCKKKQIVPKDRDINAYLHLEIQKKHITNQSQIKIFNLKKT